MQGRQEETPGLSPLVTTGRVEVASISSAAISYFFGLTSDLH